MSQTDSQSLVRWLHAGAFLVRTHQTSGTRRMSAAQRGPNGYPQGPTAALTILAAPAASAALAASAAFAALAALAAHAGDSQAGSECLACCQSAPPPGQVQTLKQPL